MSKCSICRAPFERRYLTQKTCLDSICRAEQKRQDALRKAERAELKARREKLKSRSDWLADLQAVVNEYVRLRDAKEPCISCGRFHQGQWHAGHYRSVGAAPELRFNLLNIHKQCAPCNNHKSGNAIEYRIRLVAKIGLETVEWLEGKHAPLKLKVDDIKALLAEYRAKVRELRKQKREAA